MREQETYDRTAGTVPVDGVLPLEKIWRQPRETPRYARIVIASMWAIAFAALCVIAYHLSFGAELYRRGQEHAAAEISMAAQQAGAAIAFQYEDDSLCVLLLRKKGCWEQARRMAEKTGASHSGNP